MLLSFSKDRTDFSTAKHLLKKSLARTIKQSLSLYGAEIIHGQFAKFLKIFTGNTLLLLTANYEISREQLRFCPPSPSPGLTVLGVICRPDQVIKASHIFRPEQRFMCFRSNIYFISKISEQIKRESHGPQIPCKKSFCGLIKQLYPIRFLTKPAAREPYS